MLRTSFLHTRVLAVRERFRQTHITMRVATQLTSFIALCVLIGTPTTQQSFLVGSGATAPFQGTVNSTYMHVQVDNSTHHIRRDTTSTGTKFVLQAASSAELSSLLGFLRRCIRRSVSTAAELVGKLTSARRSSFSAAWRTVLRTNLSPYGCRLIRHLLHVMSQPRVGYWFGRPTSSLQ